MKTIKNYEKQYFTSVTLLIEILNFELSDPYLRLTKRKNENVHK